MTNYNNKIEQIKSILDNYDFDHLSACYIDADFDECFYNMDDFDEVVGGFKPWEIVRAAHYGEFCPTDSYFKFNAYGNLESTDNPVREGWVDTDALAEYAIDCGEDFGDSDIQTLLEQWDEEEEPTNDYVINVGDDWENLTPFETAPTEKEAIATAEMLTAKCIEVVYSPCDDIDVNEIVWRNQKN